jgi:hypothetical protein
MLWCLSDKKFQKLLSRRIIILTNFILFIFRDKKILPLILKVMKIAWQSGNISNHSPENKTMKRENAIPV